MMLRYWLLPVIESLGVDLVMSGHDHMYYRSDPKKAGPVYILPNTGGPKKYDLKKALPPEIEDIAAKCLQPGQPVYTTVKINGSQLEYRAYTYDKENNKDVLLDQLTIKKTPSETTPQKDGAKPLPTNAFAAFPANAWHSIAGWARVLWDYTVKWIPAALRG
jgi:hypothetical protein